MRSATWMGATLWVAVAVGGCGSTVGSAPGTSDSTGPAVNLLITFPDTVSASPDLEVQQQITPRPTPPRAHIGALDPSRVYDFSVLATATDPETGIRSMRLRLNRTICYRTADGDVAQNYRPTQLRKEVTYTDRANAPVQASLGETGTFNTYTDGTHVRFDVSDRNLLAYDNAMGNRALGVGAITTWFMEATNFNGTTTNSEVIVVTAGDLSCVGVGP